MLEIRQLTFGYIKDTPILKNLNFSSQENKIGIIGKNGSGKSTLLKLISKELLPNEGEIIITGRTYRSVYDLSYYKKFTLLELIDVLSKLDSFECSDCHYFMTKLGLESYQNYQLEYLSQGTYKKIALLFSFLSTADVILLDEPFESVDEESISFIHDFLTQTSKSIILVDHDIQLVESICSSVLKLE